MDVMISLVIGFITALATVAMAAFTFVLYRATDRLFSATKASADAAKLSAEALIGAERAHLFVEITGENIREVVGRGGFFDKSESMWGQDVETLSVTYKLVNYGRTMAMLKEVSNQMIAAETFPQPCDPLSLSSRSINHLAHCTADNQKL